MEKFFSEIIYDKNENKSKGVLMPQKQEEYIPEVVGLSKLSLIMFILFSIIFGAGACALGVYFANIENQDKIKTKFKYVFENKEDNSDEKSAYIMIGRYNLLEDAESIIEKIKAKTGKTCSVKPIDNQSLVYLGPYSSESLAKNEINLILYQTSIKGSIYYEL